MKISDIPPVNAYINDVRHGPFPACKELLALCDHIERVLLNEPLRFNSDQFDRYMKLQKYFPFRLFPWEEAIFALTNCLYRADGMLRFRKLFALSGRGTGKNGYISFESFAHTTKINGVRDYHIDIFATSEDQAKTSPDEVRGILEQNHLQRNFTWNKETITNISTGSMIRYRTSNFKTKDGGKPGEVIFDEYHGFETYDLITVATTGLGKKPFPRVRIWTTDGNVRDGPLDAEKDTADDVLFKDADDLGTLAFINKLDAPEEVDDPRNWHKANPSLRYFPNLMEEIKAEYAEYKRDPLKAADFMTKRMNIPPRQRMNDVTAWQNLLAASRDLPDLTGRKCVAGIDYAKTTDMVSAGLLFQIESVYMWFQHSWICARSPALKRIKAPLRDWEKMGLLTFVNAAEVPPELVVDWLVEQASRYDLQLLGMDNFRVTLFRKALINAGFDVDDKNRVRLYKRVTEMRFAPVIISAFNNHRIIFGNDPMMRWFTNNSYVETNKDGNMIFLKKDPNARMTDGFKAMCAAFGAGYEFDDGGTVDLNDIEVYNF